MRMAFKGTHGKLDVISAYVIIHQMTKKSKSALRLAGGSSPNFTTLDPREYG